MPTLETRNETIELLFPFLRTFQVLGFVLIAIVESFLDRHVLKVSHQTFPEVHPLIIARFRQNRWDFSLEKWAVSRPSSLRLSRKV